MNLQDKYDELNNIISTLEDLIDDISDKDYKDELRETLYRAIDERDEIEPELQAMYDEEEREMNYQFERSRI